MIDDETKMADSKLFEVLLASVFRTSNRAPFKSPAVGWVRYSYYSKSDSWVVV